jgi:hypothetical protein
MDPHSLVDRISDYVYGLPVEPGTADLIDELHNIVDERTKFWEALQKIENFAASPKNLHFTYREAFEHVVDIAGRALVRRS